MFYVSQRISSKAVKHSSKESGEEEICHPDGEREIWRMGRGEGRKRGEEEERRDLRALKRRQKEEDDRNLTCIEFRGSCMSDYPRHHHCFIKLVIQSQRNGVKIYLSY